MDIQAAEKEAELVGWIRYLLQIICSAPHTIVSCRSTCGFRQAVLFHKSVSVTGLGSSNYFYTLFLLECGLGGAIPSTPSHKSIVLVLFLHLRIGAATLCGLCAGILLVCYFFKAGQVI